MQIRAEPEKTALPICNYSQILYQFLTFTQNLKRSLKRPHTFHFGKCVAFSYFDLHYILNYSFLP